MSYAPIYIGRDERMVGNIKKIVSKMSSGGKPDSQEN